MPQVISSTQVLPDSLGLTKTEVVALIPKLEALKRGDLGQVVVTDAGGQKLTLQLGNPSLQNNLSRQLAQTVADNSLTVNITLNVAHHNFIRFLNALRRWGNGATEHIFQVPGPNGNLATFRFFYTGP